MLTFLKTDKAFQRLLLFYKDPPAKILDLTYGKGHSWKGFQFKTLKGEYELTKIDINPQLEVDVVLDIKQPLKFPDDEFDVIYFDPPYYFKDKIKNFDLHGRLYGTESEVFWSFEDLIYTLQNLSREVPRLLKNKGIFIVKIGDNYVGKECFPNHFVVWHFFQKKLKICSCIVAYRHTQDSKVRGFMKANNFFYLVFQKEKLNKINLMCLKRWRFEKCLFGHTCE